MHDCVVLYKLCEREQTIRLNKGLAPNRGNTVVAP